MVIQLGRLLMAGVWLVLIWNLFVPFKSPVHLFLYFSLLFIGVMHAIKLFMLRFFLKKTGECLTVGESVRLFFFGVFELMAVSKKWQQPKDLK